MNRVFLWAKLIAVVFWAAASLLLAFTLGVEVGFQVGYEEAREDSSIGFYEEKKAPKRLLNPMIAERLDENSMDGSRAVLFDIFSSSD